VSILLAAACSTIRVRTDWDSSVDLDSFKRYAWLEPPRRPDASPFADNDLLRKKLRIAIEKALDERGFVRVETPEEADFLVTWDVTLEEQIRVNGVASGGYYGGYYGYRVWDGTSTVRTYQESTLIIDLIDAKTRQLAWRGWGDRVVPTRDRDRGQERLNMGARDILAAFPPKDASS
jgi:hypothetical protein